MMRSKPLNLHTTGVFCFLLNLSIEKQFDFFVIGTSLSYHVLASLLHLVLRGRCIRMDQWLGMFFAYFIYTVNNLGINKVGNICG